MTVLSAMQSPMEFNCCNTPLPSSTCSPPLNPLTPSKPSQHQANGDNNAYWRVLSDAGITRERLESFDRPVRCEPEWFGSGKKEVLIREFRNYLGILKAVHSGGWVWAVTQMWGGGGGEFEGGV